MTEPRVVDYTVEKLGALRILLEDGTTIDVQLIPVRVTDSGQRHPETSQPLYNIQFSQTIDQRAPEGKLAFDQLRKDVS